jgi:hypothetical protein
MSPPDLRAQLGAAMAGPGGAIGEADRLCSACVDLLDVDGAAISIIYEGVTWGTFGSSGDLSRRLDELQFTFGEGPCLEAVQQGRPVLMPDVGDPGHVRWPAFSEAMQRSGVQAVFAWPVRIAAAHVGALDLFRNSVGSFTDDAMSGASWAAELAALPLLDFMADANEDQAHETEDGWARLESLDRLEVYQATGMVMAQLGVGPAEALVRLRAHAFAHDLTASDVAWSIVERRLTMETDATWEHPGSIEPAP